MALPSPCRARLILVLICLIASYASAETPLDTDTLLKKMESTYDNVTDYPGEPGGQDF